MLRHLAIRLRRLFASHVLVAATWLICHSPASLAAPSLLADTNSFPVGVWLQDPANATRYAAAGINLFVGLWEGPTTNQLTALRRANMPVICFQNEIALHHLADTNIVAWMHVDEPDNSRTRGARFGFGSPIPPSTILSRYHLMRSNDSSRPVFLNLSQGVAWDGWYGRGNRNGHPEDYTAYLKGCDIASFDIYPVNHRSRDVSGNLWFVADGVGRLTRWRDREQPVWSIIECTHVDNPDRKPSPRQVRAMVWMSIIHGARGIIYFAHQFKPTFIEAALLADTNMLAAVSTINSRIAGLAPVLNSPSLTNAVSVRTLDPAVPVATMIKRRDDELFLFAVAMRDGTTMAKFRFQGMDSPMTAEVLDEGRTIEIENGTFSDQFKDWDVHLYRIKPR